jgi:hypothetical protein
VEVSVPIRCSCKRDNEVGRRFCGGCGTALSPACKGCGFVNAALDRFCGGCGIATAPAIPAAIPKRPVVPVPRTLTARTAPPKPPPRGKTVPIDRVDDAVLSETRVQVDETW